MNKSKKVTFTITAHVDHGKSTLSEKIIEILSKKTIRLDSLEVEQNREISVKAHPITVIDEDIDKSNTTIFNLIDTPGHIDFSSEVFTSLAVSDVVILLIDITQGVESQTIEYAKAIKSDILLVFNKIDREYEDNIIEKIRSDLYNAGINNIKEEFFISAKTGLGVQELILSIKSFRKDFEVKEGSTAIIIDSWFQKYKGLTSIIKVTSGIIKPGYNITINKKTFKVKEVGIKSIKNIQCSELENGMVGYIILNIPYISDKRDEKITPGSIIRGSSSGSKGSSKGSKQGQVKENNIQSLVKESKPISASFFLDIFPSKDENLFSKCVDLLSINDNGVISKKISSRYLGLGFRCGFLGELHSEIFFERLKKMFKEIFFISNPEVSYLIKEKEVDIYEIPYSRLKEIEVPFINIKVETPINKLTPLLNKFINNITAVSDINIKYSNEYISITFSCPYKKLIEGLVSKIKSISSGYSKISYDEIFFKKNNDILKLEYAINDEIISPLTSIEFRKDLISKGEENTAKVIEIVRREQFNIIIHALSNGKKFLRKEIKAFRKDVTAKCYGGDQTRKNKLLRKQKLGKQKNKSNSGTISIDLKRLLRRF